MPRLPALLFAALLAAPAGAQDSPRARYERAALVLSRTEARTAYLDWTRRRTDDQLALIDAAALSVLEPSAVLGWIGNNHDPEGLLPAFTPSEEAALGYAISPVQRGPMDLDVGFDWKRAGLEFDPDLGDLGVRVVARRVPRPRRPESIQGIELPDWAQRTIDNEALPLADVEFGGVPARLEVIANEKGPCPDQGPRGGMRQRCPKITGGLRLRFGGGD